MTFHVIPGQPFREMVFDGTRLKAYVPGPKRHLVRLLFWAMKKLGGTEPIYKPRVTMNWITIDAKKTVDYINEARWKFYNEVHVKITCILMGPEEFWEMSHTDAGAEFQWSDGGVRYRGLTIILVPWMKGVLPLKEIPQIVDLEKAVRQVDISERRQRVPYKQELLRKAKEAEKGSVIIAHVAHDDWCKVFENSDCTCDPNISYEEIVDEEGEDESKTGNEN